MSRILNFNGFLNEAGFFNNCLYFIFVPLDKKFKSIDKDLTLSKTLFPSERSNAGVAGYLLVPATAETSNFVRSQISQNIRTVTGEINITKSPDDDGILTFNSDVQFNPADYRSTGMKRVSAEIPGYLQQAGIYLKSGNALIFEMLVKKHAFYEEIFFEDIEERVASGFKGNKVLMLNYADMQDCVSEVKELLSIASDDIGIKVTDRRTYLKYRDISSDLLDLFKNDLSKFMELNFPQKVVEEMTDFAKESDQSEELAQTIDNLTDLKDSGFFDD